MALGDLLVKIRATATEWASDVKAIQREAKTLEKSLQPLEDAALGFGTALTAVGGTVVTAFVAMAKSTADYGDKLNDARQKTGESVESLAKLGFAAEQSGSSFDGMSNGLKFLSKNLETARDGGKQQSEAFKSLGINVTDASGKLKSTGDVLREVSDRFSNMKDGSAKTAVALQLFGKAGAELIPTLNAGSAGLDAMGDAAQRAGIVISGETAMASDEFNDRLAELQASIKGVTIQVGTVLIPILAEFAQKAINVVQAIQAWAAAHPGLIKAIAALAGFITGAGGLLLGLAGILAILPKIQIAFTLLTGPVGLVVLAISGLVAGIVYFRKEITGALLFALSRAVAGFSKFIGVAANLADAVGLDGVAGKLKGMQFSVEEAANSLDEMSNNALMPAKEETVKAAAATKEFAFQLQESSEKADKIKVKFRDIYLELVNVRKEFEQKAHLDWFKQTEDNVKELHQNLKTQTDAFVRQIIDNLNFWRDGYKSWQDTIKSSNKETMDLLEFNTKRTIDSILSANEKAKKEADELAEKQREAYQKSFDSVKETASRTFTAIWNDGKIKFSALGDTIKGIFETLANEVLSTMTAKLLTPLVNRITDTLSGVLGNIPGLGGLLGGGGISGAAAGGGAGIARGASSGAGSALSLAGGLVTGIGAGIGSFLGSLVGGARSEGTLNAIEENTRFSWLIAKNTLEQVLHPMANLVNFIAEQTKTLGFDLIPEIAYWGGLTLDTIWQAATSMTNQIVAAIQNIHIAVPMQTAMTPQLAPYQSFQGATPEGAAGFRSIFSAPGNVEADWANGLRSIFSLVPRYAGGLEYASRRHLAIIDEGESVLTKNQNMNRGNVTINLSIENLTGTDEASARRLAAMITRYVEKGGGTLTGSRLKY